MGTSPDLYMPPNAWTGSTISDLQDQTKENAAAQANADVVDMMDDVFDALIDNLFGGFGDIIQGISAGINDFIGDLLSLLDAFTGGIFNLDSLANTFNATHATAVNADSAAATAHTVAINALAEAGAANENAASAVDAAEAAANAAAAAEATADIAYNLSSYWEAECVVSSAEVVLGVNELLIGLCQNVPTGRTRKITDLHIALQSQPGGMQLQTKKWNAAGTSNSVIHTANLGANVTRISYNNLELSVLDKERVFWNVSTLTGSTAPNVLQCLVFGVIL